jgi:hypothetical protein
MFDNPRATKKNDDLVSLGNTLRDGDKVELDADQISKLRVLCQSLEAKKLVTFPSIEDKSLVYTVDHRGCGGVDVGTTRKKLNSSFTGFEWLSGVDLKLPTIEGHRQGRLGDICKNTSDGLSAKIYNILEVVGAIPPTDTIVYKVSFLDACPGSAPANTVCVALERATYNGTNFVVSEYSLLEVHKLQDISQGLVYHRKVQSNECAGGLTLSETLVKVE